MYAGGVLGEVFWCIICACLGGVVVLCVIAYALAVHSHTRLSMWNALRFGLIRIIALFCRGMLFFSFMF